VVYGNVGADGSETVRARGVVDGLHGTVIVHVRVTAFRHAVGVTGLGLGGGAVRVTVRVLAVFVLHVVSAVGRHGVNAMGRRVHGAHDHRAGGRDSVLDAVVLDDRRRDGRVSERRRRVTDDAGVRAGRGHDVRHGDGRAVRLDVLDGDDVRGGRGRQQRVRVRRAALLAAGHDDGVLGIVEVGGAGRRQRPGQFQYRVVHERRDGHDALVVVQG